MTVGWLDPATLSVPSRGLARIRATTLDEDHRCQSHWIEIDTAEKAREIAGALRDRAQFGITAFDERLSCLEGPGRLNIDPGGNLNGTVKRAGTQQAVSGRIDMQARNAPPAGTLEGLFILLGTQREDSFRTYRLGAEFPEPEPCASRSKTISKACSTKPRELGKHPPRTAGYFVRSLAAEEGR